MERKTITVSAKAENESGKISGYASTWTREPDTYGDVVAKGAFADFLTENKENGRVLPMLYNHDSYDLDKFIGTVTELREDEHGLYFEGVFDDTPMGQRARQLAMDGRLSKFSFAYDVLESAEVTLEDGRKANELRKLNVYEISLVMYPANDDTSIVDVKAGRRNSAKDAKELTGIKDLLTSALEAINGLLADDEGNDPEGDAKSKEQKANDEERREKERLLKEAEDILSEKE